MIFDHQILSVCSPVFMRIRSLSAGQRRIRWPEYLMGLSLQLNCFLVDSTCHLSRCVWVGHSTDNRVSQLPMECEWADETPWIWMCRNHVFVEFFNLVHHASCVVGVHVSLICHSYRFVHYNSTSSFTSSVGRCSCSELREFFGWSNNWHSRTYDRHVWLRVCVCVRARITGDQFSSSNGILIYRFAYAYPRNQEKQRFQVLWMEFQKSKWHHSAHRTASSSWTNINSILSLGKLLGGHWTRWAFEWKYKFRFFLHLRMRRQFPIFESIQSLATLSSGQQSGQRHVKWCSSEWNLDAHH